MSQKVLKIGTSIGATFPKNLIDKVGFKLGDSVDVEVSASGDGITIKKAKAKKITSIRDEKIARLTLDFIDQYRSDLEALKDK